jgi:hypothetical protein
MLLYEIIISTKQQGMIALNYLYLIESSILILLSFVYMFDFISNFPNSFKKSSVRILAGVLAFLSISFTATLSTNDYFLTDIIEYKQLFALIYLSYIILFLAIIKSYISSNEVIKV